MPGDRRPDIVDTDWPVWLERACAGMGVRSVYQPIVDVAAGVVAGYEALVRFDAGPANPEMWFTHARRHGMSAELDAAAIRSALSMRLKLPPNTFLTVNVSPESLTSPAVRAVWAEHHHLGGVVVELTEQTPIDSYDALAADLASLRSAGAMIAIDDAGAGYAGLRHLLAIRPEIVKLDRALICDVDRDEGKRALVEMMGTLTNRIDAWLLAEGVERSGELSTLTDLGVPLVQGYLLARPGPAWPLVEPSAALQVMTSTTTQPGAGTVRSLVTAVPTAHTVSDARRLHADHHHPVVVILDDHHRPVGLTTPDSALVDQVLPGMRIALDTPLPDAALRAMTREPATRFTPLLVTDDRGKYAGIVGLERLIHALTTAPTQPHAIPERLH